VQEAKESSALDHLKILTVHDIAADCIVMEYVASRCRIHAFGDPRRPPPATCCKGIAAGVPRRLSRRRIRSPDQSFSGLPDESAPDKTRYVVTALRLTWGAVA